MLIGIDKIPPYEKSLILVAKMAADNSQDLDVQQKTLIENCFQKIVDIWTKNKKDS